MITGPVRVSVVSDIHLGHRRNEAKFIIKNLDAHISNDAHMATIDLLILAGDVFDDLLAFNSEHVPHIKAWVARTLRLCHKYGVILRILEGTKSHDRQQSMIFEAINEIHERNSGSHIDLKWVRDVSVEVIEKFNLSVLYIPDEWKHDTADTLDDARAAIAGAGLQKVDLAIMHGQFRYQLPPVAAKDSACHNEQAYMDLVNYLIFIGHIHIHSRWETIVAQGSFDRISHGEEGAKGFVRAILHPDGTHEVKFIENIGARKFITVNCPYLEVEENLKLIDRAVEYLPSSSFVRIQSEYGNAILSNMDVLKSRWPLLLWTTPKADGKGATENELAVISAMDVYVPIVIDRHNLKSLMIPRLEKLGLEPEIMGICLDAVSEMQEL